MHVMEFFKQRTEGQSNGQDSIQFVSNDKYMKMIISDYITMQDYAEFINGVKDVKRDIYTLNLLWNARRQMINKGTYYAFGHNDNRYNIMIADDGFAIDERIPLQKGMENRTLTIYKDGRYSLKKRVDDEFGSCQDLSVYTSENFDYAARKLSREEFERDCVSIITSLESFEYIEEINNENKPLSLVKKFSEILSELAD